MKSANVASANRPLERSNALKKTNEICFHFEKSVQLWRRWSNFSILEYKRLLSLLFPLLLLQWKRRWEQESICEFEISKEFLVSSSPPLLHALERTDFPNEKKHAVALPCSS